MHARHPPAIVFDPYIFLPGAAETASRTAAPSHAKSLPAPKIRRTQDRIRVFASFLLSLQYETIRHDPRPVLRRDIRRPGARHPPHAGRCEKHGHGRHTHDHALRLPRHLYQCRVGGFLTPAAPALGQLLLARRPRLLHRLGAIQHRQPQLPARRMAPVPDRRAQQRHERRPGLHAPHRRPLGRGRHGPLPPREGAACRGRRAGRRPERRARRSTPSSPTPTK